MILKKTLKFYLQGKWEVVYFGIPNTEDEIMDLYKFRYNLYLKKNYINLSETGYDRDEYDDGRSIYFVAKWNNNIVSCVRLIRDDILPTEKAFKFDEPLFMKDIPRDYRFELGRLISIPLDEKNKKFLPRHISMIIFFNIILDFCNSNKLTAGYAFVKKTLLKKLLKIKTPIFEIKNYNQVYKDGVLYKYFNQKDDEVVPIAFLAKDFNNYLCNIFKNKLLFKIENDIIILNNNFISRLLSFFNFI